MSSEHLLASRAQIKTDGQGRAQQVIGDKDLSDVAEILNIPLYQVYVKSMEKGIVPLRYLRNMPSITLEDQITLQTACVGRGRVRRSWRSRYRRALSSGRRGAAHL